TPAVILALAGVFLYLGQILNSIPQFLSTIFRGVLLAHCPIDLKCCSSCGAHASRKSAAWLSALVPISSALLRVSSGLGRCSTPSNLESLLLHKRFISCQYLK